MNILAKFKEARKNYLDIINDSGDEIMSEIIKEIGIKHPGLTCGIIRGYTPSFNDGDICEHTSYIELYDFDNDMFEVPEDFEYNNLTREEKRSIEMELDLVDVVLIEIYGTNYEFGFTIIDGEIEVKHQDYYCEY